MAALDPKLAAIQFSISGENEAITRKIEPGAPSVKRRFVALKKLSEAGFWTTVRINPLFPKYPDGYFTDRDSTLKRFGGEIPSFPLFDIDTPETFMAMMKEAKVPTVIAGFVRLNQTSTSQLSKATGVDLRQFFKPELRKSVGESHYTNSEIFHYYRAIKAAAQNQGVRFTTCYIGNGIKDYYQYQNIWSSKEDCCDALRNVSAFKKTSQDISWEERHKHSTDKAYSLDSQKREAQMDAIFTDKNSESISNVNWDNEHHSASRIKWENRAQQPTTQE
jgi:DNA repair photolyase